MKINLKCTIPTLITVKWGVTQFTLSLNKS